MEIQLTPIGRCKNCEFWERNYFFDYEDKRFGDCHSEKLIDDSAGLNAGIEVDILRYSDCEGYAATLETGEDFGCIHWKEKESS